MFHRQKGKWQHFVKLLCVPAVFAVTSCDSPVASEARKAESEGRIINNEMMRAIYPETFVPGSPEYIERDFEAGANLICDEIKIKYERDICAEEKINWRD